ncbi:hypothetical protein ACP4OV_009183 [Aristida adscensionis]
MAEGGRRRVPPAPAPALENDDLLSDILLRLPPAPSSLPRASLVCKRWRRLVTGRRFLRRFRARHRRAAPLLGFFSCVPRAPVFTPTLDGPDRLPPERLSLPLLDDYGLRLLGCRHGLVLLHSPARDELLVREPGAGALSRVPVPPAFAGGGSAPVEIGAVLRAAGDGDGDGEDHWIPPFVVALVGADGARAFASVYSSEAGEWGDLVSAACQSIRLDLERRCLAVVPTPANIFCTSNYLRHWVIPGEGGELGFLHLSGYSVAELWSRKSDHGGAAQWVLRRTVDLGNLLSLSAEDGYLLILGFSEEDKVFFVAPMVPFIAPEKDRFCCMVQLESLQSKKSFYVSKLDIYHPFSSVYTAEAWAQLVNRMGL